MQRSSKHHQLTQTPRSLASQFSLPIPLYKFLLFIMYNESSRFSNMNMIIVSNIPTWMMLRPHTIESSEKPWFWSSINYFILKVNLLLTVLSLACGALLCMDHTMHATLLREGLFTGILLMLLFTPLNHKWEKKIVAIAVEIRYIHK